MLPQIKLLAACLVLGCCSLAAAEGGRIALEILEPEGRKAIERYPVAVGMVFPEGELKDAGRGRVVDDAGQTVPALAEATGWWDADRSSVRWLLLRFNADTRRQYFFEPAAQAEPLTGALLAVRDDKGDITINTGPMQARLAARSGLIGDLKLNGRRVIHPSGLGFILSIDNGKSAQQLRLEDWKLTLDENTPLHATTTASAYYRDSNGAGWNHPVARLDVRMVFHRHESFIRLYHTITWMGANPNQRVREWSVSLRPELEPSGQVEIGRADGSTWTDTYDQATHLFAQQDDAQRYTITVDGKPAEEGKQIDGHIALRDDDGRGAAVTLRHAWQTYPTAVELNKGMLTVQMWPPRGPHMSFTPLGIQGKDIFYHPAWKYFPWSQEESHFVHERARQDWYMHTPQGAARTHEMTLHLFDSATERDSATVRDITHRPVVLRQDPRSALRVPMMGLRLSPYDPQKYPQIERAIDVLGRLSMGRWAQMHELGFWKFGFTRWGRPFTSDTGRSMYRWMDGAQYDQQLIPWLLFIRGGGREWFEEAEITSRMLMDVGVNHYNTRGFPTGYMATAGGTPFPYVPFHTTKGTKIHFLSFYHHLTGYRRAREVMDTVIAGTLATAGMDQEQLPPWYRRTGGREAYNMNVFWANAWQETLDPAVKAFADEWLTIAAEREYSEEHNTFRPPQIYLYNGLLLQQQRTNDPDLARIMLRNLDSNVMSAVHSGGVRQVEYLVAAQWAFDRTKDQRWVRVAWDVARSLADSLPNANTAGTMPPQYAMPGNCINRQYLMPILVGLSLAHEHGLDEREPFVRNDTFVKVSAATAPSGGHVLVRPHSDGDLMLRVKLAGRTAKHVAVSVLDADGEQVAAAELAEGARQTVTLDGPGYGISVGGEPAAELRIAGASSSKTYRLVFTGADKNTMVLVQADAGIVHHLPVGQPLLVTSMAGQTDAGTRFVVRSAQDVITVTTNSPARSPYSIRDARTGELLFVSDADQASRQTHEVGAGRLLLFTVGGYEAWTLRTFEGIDPWVSATARHWFQP